MNILQHVAALIGRLALSVIFIWSGTQNILGWDDVLQEIPTKIAVCSQPWVTEHAHVVALVLAILATVLLFGGGVIMALGLRARLGALLLMLLLVPVTLLYHNFWSFDPADTIYREQAIHFLKNISLLGGLLMVVAFGGGAIGADGLFRRNRNA